jgi:hypothetical protein
MKTAKQIAQLAATVRLPAIYGYREHVEVGGLMSYEPDIRDSSSSPRQNHRMNPEHHAGPPMTLGDMRELGVRHDRRRRAPELA